VQPLNLIIIFSANFMSKKKWLLSPSAEQVIEGASIFRISLVHWFNKNIIAGITKPDNEYITSKILVLKHAEKIKS